MRVPPPPEFFDVKIHNLSHLEKKDIDVYVSFMYIDISTCIHTWLRENYDWLFQGLHIVFYS